MYCVGDYVGIHFSQVGDWVILCTGWRFSQVSYFGVSELGVSDFEEMNSKENDITREGGKNDATSFLQL